MSLELILILVLIIFLSIAVGYLILQNIKNSQKDLAEVFGQFNFIKTGDTFLFYLACTDDYKVQRQDGTYMWVSAKYNLEYKASENNYKPPSEAPGFLCANGG